METGNSLGFASRIRNGGGKEGKEGREEKVFKDGK